LTDSIARKSYLKRLFSDGLVLTDSFSGLRITPPYRVAREFEIKIDDAEIILEHIGEQSLVSEDSEIILESPEEQIIKSGEKTINLNIS
jgi:hypothetical protein